VKHPLQLTIKELNVIKQYCLDPINKFKSLYAIYAAIMKDGSAYFCKSTFYKYCRIFKFTRKGKAKFDKRHTKGIIASKPFEKIHMDISLYNIKGTTYYIYVVVDNYSRLILNTNVHYIKSAKLAFDNLYDGLMKYNALEIVNEVEVYMDGGSENKWKNEYLFNNLVRLSKKVARKHVAFSNNMVEACIKRIKNNYLNKKTIANNIEAVKKELDFAVNELNNSAHSMLDYRTPLETFYGVKPYNFKVQIQQAKTKRIKENLKKRCCTN